MSSIKSRCINIIDKCYIEVLIIGFLLYRLLITKNDLLCGYVSLWYAIDYSYGFGSRLLIGTIMRLISPGGYVQNDTAYAFVIIANIILCAILGILLGKVLRKALTYGNDVFFAVSVLVVLYLASPATPEYLWNGANLGRLDTFLIINMMIIILISFKVKNRVIRYISFLSIALISILIHQIYFFLFFPSLLVIYICDTWKYGVDKKDKKQYLIVIGSVVIIFLAFCFMQFCSGVYYDDLDELYNDLCASTSVYVDIAPLQAEYFWSIKDHFVTNMLPDMKERIRFAPLTVIMLAPMWAIYTKIWNMVIKSANDRVQKWKYILIRLTYILYIPVFALMNDYGRWFAALFIMMLMNLLVLIFNKDELVVDAVAKCGAFFKKYPIVPLMIIVYIAGFEKFWALHWIQEVQDFFYASYDLFAMFFR